MPDNMRVMRIVVPVEQIRRMDQIIIRGIGGFQNRNEFLSEAIESLLLDLSFPGADAEPAGSDERHMLGKAELSSPADLALDAPERGYVMQPGPLRQAQPIFGLHNRDYPSIWALWRLSRLAHEAPVRFATAVRAVTDEAWVVGRQLSAFQPGAGETIASLFPTNPAKREAAESAFREFAIGSAVPEGAALRTSGPLFQWAVCSAVVDGSDVMMGVTEPGWDLLRLLNGLEPVQPHSPVHAQAFLSHLRSWAPADWKCFEVVLAMCDSGSPARAEVVAGFASHLGLTNENVASTYAAGYVARCREWGLLAPKQVKGTYVITDLGRSVLGGARDEDK